MATASFADKMHLLGRVVRVGAGSLRDRYAPAHALSDLESIAAVARG